MTSPVRRLKILRNFLATNVKPHAFSMETFKGKSACGTHMCIGGHMARIRFFYRMGYKLKAYRNEDGTVAFYDPINERKGLTQSEHAIRDALAISSADVNRLCFRWGHVHGEPALKQKLAEIDKLIEKYGAKE